MPSCAHRTGACQAGLRGTKTKCTQQGAPATLGWRRPSMALAASDGSRVAATRVASPRGADPGSLAAPPRPLRGRAGSSTACEVASAQFRAGLTAGREGPARGWRPFQSTSVQQWVQHGRSAAGNHPELCPDVQLPTGCPAPPLPWPKWACWHFALCWVRLHGLEARIRRTTRQRVALRAGLGHGARAAAGGRPRACTPTTSMQRQRALLIDALYLSNV